MTTAQRLHWEYQQRRARQRQGAHPGRAQQLIRKAEQQLLQQRGAWG